MPWSIRRFWIRSSSPRPLQHPQQLRPSNLRFADRVRLAVARFSEILMELDQFVRAEGGQLVVLLIPTKRQVEGESIDEVVFQETALELGLSSAGLDFDDVRFSSFSGNHLHGYFLKAQEPAKGTIVHCHGNDANVTEYAAKMAYLVRAGYNVFCFDYSGYGQSTGTRSPKGMAYSGLDVLFMPKSGPFIRRSTDEDGVFELPFEAVPGMLRVSSHDFAFLRIARKR